MYLQIIIQIIGKINILQIYLFGKAVRASSSFPGVFCPCEYKNHLFLDGGTLNNIPIKEAINLGADKVITVQFEPINVSKDSNAMEIILKTLDIMGNDSAKENLKNSDIILKIPAESHVSLLNTNQMENNYKYGYEITNKNIDKIKKMIDE